MAACGLMRSPSIGLMHNNGAQGSRSTRSQVAPWPDLIRNLSPKIMSTAIIWARLDGGHRGRKSSPARWEVGAETIRLAGSSWIGQHKGTKLDSRLILSGLLTRAYLPTSWPIWWPNHYGEPKQCLTTFAPVSTVYVSSPGKASQVYPAGSHASDRACWNSNIVAWLLLYMFVTS